MTTNLDLQHETLGSIISLAQKADSAANRVALVAIPNHPNHDYLVVKENGNYEQHELPLPPRATKLASVDQPGLFALHAHQKWDCNPAIYYDPACINIRLEDSNLEKGRGVAACPLTQTEVWKRLDNWSADPNTAWLSHKVFIRELRVTFGECFASGDLDRLIDAIGQLDFIQGERTQSVAVRNRESMGREVMAEVKSVKGDIPEQVLLGVRIYRDPILLRQHPIRCLLETDPSNGRLALIPLAGELDNALDAEMQSLGELLRASVRSSRLLTGPDESATTDLAPNWQIPVFYGQP